MNKETIGPDGISEVLSIILLIAVTLILAYFVYILVFGPMSLLKPTSRIAAYAGTTTVPLGDTIPPMQIIDIQAMAGDYYYLTGQQNIPPDATKTAVASFTLLDPQGNSYPVVPTILSPDANKYGTTLYLYKGQNSVYRVTDNLSSISYAPTQLYPFDLGEYKITMIDTTADVILDTMDVTITGNPASSAGTSLPAPPLLNIEPNATWEMHGGVTNSTDPSSGLTIYTFDGTSGYLSGQSNPALAFTGDMTLSLWMDPTATGDPNNPSDWHTIIGKGQLNGGSSENDNYQLVQIGDELYFEWNDASTGIHYHIMTDSGPVQAGQTGYVDLTVNSGVPAIYYNGVAQPFNYYQSNYPTDTSTIAPVPVNMQNDSNDLLTGKQNGPPGDEFYYQGQMSEVALYNYALSSDSITHNLDYDQI